MEIRALAALSRPIHCRGRRLPPEKAGRLRTRTSKGGPIYVTTNRSTVERDVKGRAVVTLRAPSLLEAISKFIGSWYFTVAAGLFRRRRMRLRRKPCFIGQT